MKFDEWPEILTPHEVREILQVSNREAFAMFKRPGFPCVTPGKRRGQQVGKYAFRDWINKGTVKP